MVAAVKSANDGSGRLVVLDGPAGMGKSTILRRLESSVRAVGGVVLRGGGVGVGAIAGRYGRGSPSSARGLPKAIENSRVAHYFSGNWGGFALLVAVALLAPIVEELVFRGLLLPRMRAAFGRGDVVASGVLHTLYHLHQPWSMPATLIDSILNQAYPTRRFRSTWIGARVAHRPVLVIIAVVLTHVL